ncbi:MAG: PepSY domain-containing protein [Clostridiales bacterium]|nr:PepSY domain-containing protein [Clostridiales bacterium]
MMKRKNCGALLLLLLFLLTGCGAEGGAGTDTEGDASASAAGAEASGSDVTLEDVTVESTAPAESDGAAAEETPEDAAAESAAEASAAAAEVTLEDVKITALAHAGVEAASASFTEARLHRDGTAYEVEFTTADGQYEYELSADSGEILSYQWEVQGQNVNTGTAPDSLDSAKALALSHAGVEADAASFEKEKLDDGVYELEFTTANGEYEYEISRETGVILEYEWDVQGSAAADAASGGADSTGQTVNAAVTASQAESIALEAAGLAEGDTKYLHSYVEWRHDAPYAWCVEFGVRDTEYVYLIDLEDGTILEQYVESH